MHYWIQRKFAGANLPNICPVCGDAPGWNLVCARCTPEPAEELDRIADERAYAQEVRSYALVFEAVLNESRSCEVCGSPSDFRRWCPDHFWSSYHDVAEPRVPTQDPF